MMHWIQRAVRIAYRCILVGLVALAACLASGCAKSKANRPTGDPIARIRPDLVLPEVHLRPDKSSLSAAYSKRYIFTQDWFTPEIPTWELALASYKGKPGLRYLEIGTFEGRSLMWMQDNMLTDPASSAVAIDPFTGDYRNRYYANLKQSGAENRVTTIAGYSQVELRKLPLESIDIIYVDGSHTVDDVLEDAILCLRLLKHGGMLIFDDYKWTGWNKVEPPENTPGPAIDIFYAIYGKQLEVIHKAYQVMLRKK